MTPYNTRWVRYCESPPGIDPITQSQLNDYANSILGLPNMAIFLSTAMPEALKISNWTEAQLAKLRSATRKVRYSCNTSPLSL